MKAVSKLIKEIKSKETCLVVGLDPIYHQIPHCFKTLTSSLDRINQANQTNQVIKTIENFCTTIIDTCAEHVGVIKIQASFFERFGSLGFKCLEQVSKHAYNLGLFVIVDVKRGDIATSAEGYADYYFPSPNDQVSSNNQTPRLINADAITLNPFMGMDTIEPFVKAANQAEGMTFILNKTSNKGSDLIQNFKNNSNQKVYELLAEQINLLAQKYKCSKTGYSLVGNVVGATFPEEARIIRKKCPNSFFLVPGIGAQGGDVKSLSNFFNPDGLGAIINSSRGIIFSYSKYGYDVKITIKEYQKSVSRAIQEHKTLINQIFD